MGNLAALQKTTWEFRADTGKVVGNWTRTPEGYLVAQARIARIGIQEYKNLDGSIRREFRSPEEVSDSSSLQTLRKLTLTKEHPPELLTSKNTRQYLIGWSGDSVVYDGGFVTSEIKIIDEQAIQDVLDNLRVELSVGYKTRLDWTPGVWEGARYDCIQRQIRGNHLALTTKARGGESIRLYLPGEIQFKLKSPEEQIVKEDSEHLEKCWQSSTDEWPQSEVRFDDSYKKIGGEPFMDQYSEDDLKEMSRSDLVNLILEMQSEGADEELKEAKDSAAYYEGKALQLQERIDAWGDTPDVSGRTDSRVKEKNIRIQELENKLDSVEAETTSLRRQLDEYRDRNRRLDSDLTAERTAKHTEIKNARENWIKVWLQAAPYLPGVAKSDPDYTMDSIEIMRLAVQNSRPNLNLDALVDGADNPDDAVKTAFSVMISEGKMRQDSNGSAMKHAIYEAKNYASDSNNNVDHAVKVKKLEEAWKVRN